MSLAPGQALSFYEVLGPLGAGGMGEVYLARDTRLDREVAIKVLPAELANDEERLRRFEREAKTLAALNHTNIAGIHGIDQVDETCFIAMELVPGEDLELRLKRGALSIDEALDVCRQLAEGLEVAHEAGIVHRDLKPANVRITPEGVLKILDFGLAKPMHPGHSKTGSSSAQKDSFLITEEGLVLGTPTYMSPEQARGKAVDKRTDIWAFGCVLYECLTGKRAFGGASVTDVLAAIVSEQPDWSALPVGTPGHVRALLARCLAKDPRARLRDIGEARVGLVGPQPVFGDSGLAGAELLAGKNRRATWLPWAIALVSVGLAGARFLWRGSENAGPNRQVRFTIHHPSQTPALLSNPLVAPDGSYVAYVAAEGNSRRLWVRELDSKAPRALPDTEGVEAPFVSADSRFIGFYADNKLKKVAVSGGTPVDIGEISNNPGAAWNADGTLVYSRTWTSGLMHMRSEGSAAEELTTIDAAAGESGHWWPTPLPGGHKLLRTIFTRDGSLNKARIELFDPSTGLARFVADGAQPLLLESGHLLYFRAGIYELAPFDAKSGTLTGPPRTVLPEVSPIAPEGSSRRFVSISKSGVLAYVVRGAPLRWFWMDTSGALEALALPVETLGSPALSRDGSLAIVRSVAGETDIFVHDLEAGTETRITNGPVNNAPEWSADGKRLLFASLKLGSYDVFEADPTGARAVQPLFTWAADINMGGLIPMGKRLVASLDQGATGEDIVVVDLESGKFEVLIATPGNDEGPTPSPDGQLVAYQSNVSGTKHIYVVPLSGECFPLKVSRGGGNSPSWTMGGSKLAFLDGAEVMLVDISFRDGQLSASRPVPFVTHGLSADLLPRFTGEYAINAEGNRMIIGLLDEPAQAEIEVVLDGFRALGVR